MDDLITELKSSISRNNDDEDHILMSSQYVPLKIDVQNFHSYHMRSGMFRNILFVDGGNSILFESAGFCLGFIRICGILYKDNKRVMKKSREFYILIREDNGVFNIKTFPDSDFSKLVFKPEDESLRNGLERSNPSRIVSVIRRFAELDFAGSSDSSEIDYVLLDGTLESRYPYESEHLKKLFSSKKICSLSKTCALVTKNGVPITKKLYDLKSGSWYYTPIVLNKNPRHEANLYFVKLNDKSRHVFRFEVQNGFNGKIEELLEALSQNSVDPIFPGYPYGMIDVDSNARVSEEEKKSLQTRVSVKLGKQWNEFSKSLNSLNAHEILDRVRF